MYVIYIIYISELVSHSQHIFAATIIIILLFRSQPLIDLTTLVLVAHTLNHVRNFPMTLDDGWML